MTPVTFLGELVLPPVKPNTFKMLLKYLWDHEYKTDKSKRRIVGFGGKVLTDKKSG
jgi:hypothetical protein